MATKQSTKSSRRTHGATGTPEYVSWHGMLSRCRHKDRKDAKYYVERGITVCRGLAESFSRFLDVLGYKPSAEMSVDRIENSGNYSCGTCEECVARGWPMNLRWATRSMQTRNQRTNVLLTWNGETKTAIEWAEQLGRDPRLIYDRVRIGWDDERVLATPVKQHSPRREISLDGLVARDHWCVGKDFGLWHVQAYFGTRRCLCRCLCRGCNKEFPVRLDHMTRGTSLGCQDCRRKSRPQRTAG